MLAPPVKGARTTLRSARVVKTTKVAQSQDGVTTRYVTAGVSFCAIADRPCRQSREVREQAQTGMERQGSTRI